jgi:hypothetical protein
MLASPELWPSTGLLLAIVAIVALGVVLLTTLGSVVVRSIAVAAVSSTSCRVGPPVNVDHKLDRRIGLQRRWRRCTASRQESVRDHNDDGCREHASKKNATSQAPIGS